MSHSIQPLSDFEKIFREHKNTVYNVAMHYAQNPEDAEEITMDVFVALHHGLEDFKEQSKLSTWIYRIAINKSLDFLKTKKRKKRFALLTSIFTGTNERPEFAHFNHPGVLMEQNEEVKRIFEIIDGLPENQKTAIILMKIENKNQKETAEIMGMSTKAVESLVQRAKQAIQLKLTNTQ